MSDVKLYLSEEHDRAQGATLFTVDLRIGVSARLSDDALAQACFDLREETLSCMIEQVIHTLYGDVLISIREVRRAVLEEPFFGQAKVLEALRETSDIMSPAAVRERVEVLHRSKKP